MLYVYIYIYIYMCESIVGESIVKSPYRYRVRDDEIQPWAPPEAAPLLSLSLLLLLLQL